MPLVEAFLPSHPKITVETLPSIRKRKHVETLARALLLQQQILEETVKSVVLACGCENVGALEEDPFEYFGSEEVRERVEEYLGPKNGVAFMGLLTANNDVVKKVAKNISGLVPTHQVRNSVANPSLGIGNWRFAIRQTSH